MLNKIIVFTILVIGISTQGTFIGPDYQAMSAQDKMNLMWPQITADNTPGTFYTWQELLFVVESMDVTLDYVSDQMPSDRLKLIHTVGVIGQVQFVPIAGQPYTGIFNTGSPYGLLRLSLAHSYKTATADEQTAEGANGNFVPGLSIKLFRNGVPSANMVSMFSVGGQPSWNYFKNNFTNHIPPPEGTVLHAVGDIFAKGTKYIQYIGLKDWGSFDYYGNNITNPVYPFELHWVPNPNISISFPDYYVESMDWAAQCMSIQPDNLIYTIYARPTPTDDFVAVANVVANSNFNYSTFGDKTFFIQHNRMSYDLEDHPEWQPYVHAWSLLRNLRETDQEKQDKVEGCPFLN